MVRGYAAAFPSRYRNAKDFCTRLPEFLAKAEPYRSHPEVSELAALERALNDAFYAKDEGVIGIEHLKAFAAGDWGNLRFRPHPSASWLTFMTNAAEIWSALKQEAHPPSSEANGPHCILVWRQDVPKFRVLEEEEAMLWKEAVNGVRFGILCEMAATYNDAGQASFRVAGYLQLWVAFGFLSAAMLA